MRSESSVAIQLKAAIAALLGLALAGCLVLSEEKRTIRTIESVNSAVWKAKNNLLLTNILRARDREPRLFSTIGQLTGGQGSGPSTASLSIPFGGKSEANYTFMPGFNLTDGSTFTMTVQETQQFTRALLTPVDSQTIRYFLNSGWPDEQVWLLLASRISFENLDSESCTVTEENGAKRRYLDNQGSKESNEIDGFNHFRDMLRQLQKCDLSFVRLVGPPVGPPVKEEVIIDIPKAVGDAEVAKLVLDVKTLDKYVTYREVQWVPAVALKGKHKQPECWAVTADPAYKDWSIDKAEAVDPTPPMDRCTSAAFDLQIRSAEGVVYYLGQLARLQDKHPGQKAANAVKICWRWDRKAPRENDVRGPYELSDSDQWECAVDEDGRRDERTLFVVNKTDRHTPEDFAEARIGGARYAVRSRNKDDDDASSATMNLVSLLLSLYTAREDLPQVPLLISR